MFDHTTYLAEVETANPADVGHVDFILGKLDGYVRSEGREGVGDFLQGIILGDLHRATGYADGTNKKYIALYVQYCYNQLPSDLVMLGRPVLDLLRTFLFDKEKSLTREQVQDATQAFASALEEIRGR